MSSDEGDLQPRKRSIKTETDAAALLSCPFLFGSTGIKLSSLISRDNEPGSASESLGLQQTRDLYVK